jgi:hypothetical protein
MIPKPMAAGFSVILIRRVRILAVRKMSRQHGRLPRRRLPIRSAAGYHVEIPVQRQAASAVPPSGIRVALPSGHDNLHQPSNARH